MSKYLLDKFLFTVDRDPELVERYRDDPVGTVSWWEAERANTILNCTAQERSTWLAFTRKSRLNSESSSKTWRAAFATTTASEAVTTAP